MCPDALPPDPGVRRTPINHQSTPVSPTPHGFEIRVGDKFVVTPKSNAASAADTTVGQHYPRRPQDVDLFITGYIEPSEMCPDALPPDPGVRRTPINHQSTPVSPTPRCFGNHSRNNAASAADTTVGHCKGRIADRSYGKRHQTHPSATSWCHNHTR